MKNTEYRVTNRIILFVVCLFLSLSSALGQSTPRTRYVKPTATGTMDGTSWANAMTLQAALDGHMSGDLLYLMKGSYTPTAKKVDGMAVAMGQERDATYILPSGVTLYGGFAGTETSHTARTMDEIHDDNATIIEGDIGTMRTETQANNTDNIQRLFILASDGTATLDGLTVARARLDGVASGAGIAGGTGTNITLRLCRFIGNAARTGGAVFVSTGSTVTVTNSTFEGNSARNGGGAIFVWEGVTLMATGSTFRENTTGNAQNGSAIYLNSSTATPSTGTISRCSFFGNSATGASFGAVYVFTGSTLHVSNSIFAGNSMGSGAAVSSSGNGTFINNTVYGNTNRPSNSAAVSFSISASTWVFANNIIYGNTGSHQLNFGSAANKTMAHNLIEGNSINNSPNRTGALTAPATAAEVFASTTATEATYLRLISTSVGVDAGNNDYIDGDGSSTYTAGQGVAIKDRTGENRVRDTRVDVGAYESPVFRVRYVKPTATGTMDGTSWANAMTLQAALDGYASGDILYLMKGSYTPTAKKADGMAVAMGQERDATYILPSGITLYGGFAGTEASHTARDMDEIHDDNATTIEGDIGTMRTNMAANNTDNIQRLFTVANNGIATLDGLTVARAHLDGTNDGGGLSGGTGTNITLRLCRFIGNTANWGGAVYVNTGATLIVANSTFEGNSARSSGGAISVSEGSTFTTTGSTFRENTAGNGSAIVLSALAVNPSTGTIARCSFFGNSAPGTSLGTVNADIGSTLHVSNSVFANNSMRVGAAVYSDGGHGTFINNTVYGNSRDRSSTVSAAVNVAGSASTWVVANNIIYGNTGSHQVFFNTAANKTMAHNLIQGNSISTVSGTLDRTGPLTAPATAAEVFASTTATDENYLRLASASVGVDAGNNDYIDGNGTTAYEVSQGTAIKDRTGENRVRNMAVDVGAFESAPTTAPFLRVLGTRGETLSTSGRNLLPAAAGTSTLQVVYGGTGAMGVSVTETTDADNILSSVTASVSSSPGDVDLVLVANTTNREREVTLTFTLQGATLDDVVLTFTQRRGAASAVYVAANGRETASGLDWANATTLQAALDNRLFPEDSLFLRAGVYTPTAKNSDGNAVTRPRNATYTLPDGIKIYGGFAGTETEAAGREMSLLHTTNATIIEGDIGREESNIGNVKRLLYLAAEGTATLDGLTVARAFNDGGDGAADGAGLHAESGSRVTLRNCRFIGNRGRDGGGVFVKSTAASSSTLTVTGCIFEDNVANTGGGIRIEAGGRLTVTDSRFEDNEAILTTCCGGGAIYVSEDGTLTATGSTFRGNTAAHNRNGSAILLVSTLANASTGTFSRCTFVGNSAPGTSLGTVYAGEGATLHVSNSLFAGNTMGSGAGVYSTGARGSFINNTVYGNTDRATASGAVSLLENLSTWVVANSIIYGNTAAHQLQFSATANKTLAHNLIQGGDDGIENGPTRTEAVTAPMSASDLFASTTATDANYLRLALASAGVNAGNNDYIDGNADAYDAMEDASITDLMGRGRISNSVVDVGAYELYVRKIAFNPVMPADVVAGGGMVTLTVTFEGGATGFSVPASGEGAPAGWLTVPPAVTMSGGQNQLTITVTENMGIMARSSMIVFTPAGGTGTASPTTLTITQLGVPQPRIVFAPATPADVAVGGGMVTLTVTFEGGATGFSVPASGEGAPASWLTVPAAVAMTGGQNQLAITVLANTGAMDRSSMIVFTATGGSVTAATTALTITQLGTAPRQRIVFAPAMPADVVAGGGMVSLTVTFEGGATGFSVPTSGEGAPASWLMVPSVITMSGGQNQLAITVEENTGIMDRSSMIVFTPTGGAGTASPTTLTITQLGTAPRQTIVFAPAMPADVVAGGGMVSLTVTFGGGATGFSVPTSGEGAPASWLTVPSAVTMSGGQNQLAITVVANTGASERSSMVVFTPTGGTGTARPTTLTITQAPASPRIVFDPATPADVASAGAKVSLTVTFEGGATGFSVPSSGEGAPASWLTVPAAVTMAGGQNRLAITVMANTGTSERSSMIVFTPTGGTGTAIPTTLTITQAAQQGGVSFGVSGGVFAEVRVVNPTSDELVIYGIAKEVGLLLRDVSGREVFSGSLPLGEQRIPLPPLARGVYVLALRDENGQVHHVRLLKE